MRYYSSLVVLPLAAQALEARGNGFVQKDGIVRYPITVSGGAPSKVKGLRKRQDVASLTSRKLGFFYTIDIGIGTPPQYVSVNFDTGSSELWVNPNCEKADDAKFCQGFGRYNESKTFVDTKAPGGIKYGTGFVDFTYGYDHIEIGEAKISQQLFGVADDSEFASVGMLGAGPSLDGWHSPYPFVIDTMAKQGIINSRAFSLDIREFGSEDGAVIYGGIDTKKFSGPLEKLPIIPAKQSPDGNTRYWVYLDGISITTEEGYNVAIFDKDNGQPVLLDSGYTISALPGPIFTQILNAFPSAKEDGDSGEYFVDCKVAESGGSVNFRFGKTLVKVPYNDFLWQQLDGTCKLGVSKDDEFPVLGDTVMRAAYLVYDWDNRNVHIANNQDCGSNLVAIGKGVDAVPSVIGECGAPSATTSKMPLTTAPLTTAPLTTALLTMAPLTTAAPGTNATGTAGTGTAALGTATLGGGPLTTGVSGALGGQDGGVATSALWSNATAAAPTMTSTMTTTMIHTITSCPPTVTNCPVGSVTTETITAYVTYCPVKGGGAMGAAATQFAETTATYTLPSTYTCSKGLSTCASQTPGHVITVSPIATQTVPVKIPHCATCGAPEVPDLAATPAETQAITSAVFSPQSSSTVTPGVPAPAVMTAVPSGGLKTVTSACSTCGVAASSGSVASSSFSPGSPPIPTQDSSSPGIPISGASEYKVPSIAGMFAGAAVFAFL